MKARTLIDTAFRDIPDIYSGFNLMRDVIQSAALEGEKRHRNSRSDSPRNFPASLAAKYFTVKWLAEYTLQPSRLPSIADIHRMRHDCVLAASFSADNVGVLYAWAMAVPAEFWELDYAKLMQAQS